MNALNKFANGMKRLLSVYLHNAMDIISNPALANHTPVGPGSLAIGQGAAAGRSGPHIRLGGCGSADKPAQARPTDIEYSMPLRQVFWL